MSLHENFREREFLIEDSDSRIRDSENLQKFLLKDSQTKQGSGDFLIIPKGTIVAVSEIRVVPAGSTSWRVFALATTPDSSSTWGWTSSRNFSDKFRNVTLGLIEPEAGAGQYSATAAWRSGSYTGQVSLVQIVDATLDLETVSVTLLSNYLDMVDAAQRDNISTYINSGFRSYSQQKHLYDGYRKGLPGYNLAAKPGYSNHQSGIAFDIPVAGGPGNPEYDWLAREGTAHGFIRTVKSEPWHWEYRPAEAEKARKRGSHTIWN